jgi:filamentous hemagglutinin
MNTLLAQEAAGLGLAGGLAVVSGAAGGHAAAGAAFNTDVNNRQIHHGERERIKRAAGGDKVREEKLTKAACFEVKCWAQYPEGSELYNQHYVSVAEMAFLQDEWAWVKGQQAQGEFLYTPSQWAADGIAANTGMARDSFRGQRIEAMPPSNEADACVTGECAAGVLPAPSEMRSVEEINDDLDRRICAWSVGAGNPLPGSALMKPVYDRFGKIVGWVTEGRVGNATSSLGERLICN